MGSGVLDDVFALLTKATELESENRIEAATKVRHSCVKNVGKCDLFRTSTSALIFGIIIPLTTSFLLNPF